MENYCCKNCTQQFEITDRDRQFLTKIAPVINGQTYEIPEPTHCPPCRQQRRYTFRNERNLYKRECDFSKKPIISMYHEDSPYPVYDQSIWWSDQWDAQEHAQEFDFNRPFFEQYHKLSKKVPKIALLNVNRENSEYCNFTGDVKNSYLIFGSVYSEDCMYGSPYYSKDCIDSLVIRDCELCYECSDCRKLYDCKYCHNCTNSSGLLFCKNMHACKECIGCAGLRNKEYCVFNKQYTKDEYERMKTELDLTNPAVRKKLQEQCDALDAEIPHKYMQTHGCENVTGDHVYNSKNTFHSFFTDRCEDCSYCCQVVDLKDCYDCNFTEENELCYEYLGMYGNKNIFFSVFGRHCYDVWYSDNCINCQHCFGCSGLKNKKYCILNKQCSEEEYWELLPKVIEHMKSYGEWGEFFPITIAPFAYNESVAQEYFPISQEEAREKEYIWKKKDEREFRKPVSPDVLACTDCGKNYRIIPQEQSLYDRMKVAIPNQCPDCRHHERIQKRNGLIIEKKSCEACKRELETTLTGNKIYCEPCYQKIFV